MRLDTYLESFDTNNTFLGKQSCRCYEKSAVSV